MDDASALCDRGIALNNAGRYLEAVDSLKKALRLRPDFTDARFNLGTSYAALGQSRKSGSLAMFMPLSRLPGGRLLDLQYGDTAAERAAFEAAGGALMHLPGLYLFNDLEGVLAAIQACDLAVTTSNVTAHFAGAPGKETLRVYPGGDSPFYYRVPGEDGRCLGLPLGEIGCRPGARHLGQGDDPRFV